MASAPLPVSLDRWTLDAGGGRLVLHASAVALGTRGVLICGRAGCGKSHLAMALIGLGAQMVSDDICEVVPCTAPTTDGLEIRRPADAVAAVEARGIGLLNSGPITTKALLCALVDLETVETVRLPPKRCVAIGAGQAPLILGADRDGLCFEIMHLLRFGWYMD